MAENVLRFDFLARDKASPTFQRLGHESDSLGSKVGHFGKVAAIAFGTAAAGGIIALTKGFKDGVQAASEYQALGLKTAAVIKSTGNVAHISVKGVQTLASQLESLGTTDEELIINSQNVLATFTKIRNVGKNRIFDQAERSTLDMSVALGEDLQSATIQVGKALNDPIKGITALSRVGVSFTKQQKDQIKAMVESGHTMDAQKVILKELNTEFGGAAKAAGSGFKGAIFRAKDALGDFERDMGKKALPALTNFANWFAGVGIPKLRVFVDWMSTTGVARIVSGFTKARDGVADVWKRLDLSGIGKNLQDQAKDWGGLLILGVKVGLQTGNWGELGKILGEGLSNAITAGAAGSGKLVGAIGKWIESVDWEVVGKQAGMTAVPFIVGFFTTLVDGLFKVVKEHPVDTLLLIATLIPLGKLLSAFKPIRDLVEHLPLGKWFTSAADHSAAPVFDAIWTFVRFMGREFMKGFRAADGMVGGAVGKFIRGIGDDIGLRALYLADRVTEFFGGIARGAGRMAGRIAFTMRQVIGWLVKPYADAGGWLIRQGSDLIGGALRGVRSQSSAIGRGMVTVIRWLTRPFARAGSWLYQAGRELLRGLRDGMYNGVSAAGSWAAGVGGRIVRAVKGFFGIRSPSRVFAGIGKNLITSLFNSMIDHNPVQAITKIFGGMPQALGALVDKGLVKITSLPGKAMSALAGLGGKFASLFGGGGGGMGGIRIGGTTPAEAWIIAHESGGRTNAANPTSTAFGLGQLLLANRQHYGAILGVSPNTTSVGAQLAMFRMYVRDRYGTAENAKSFWMAHHWYGSGGVVSRPQLVGAGDGGPERVLSARQTADFGNLVRVLDRGSNTPQSAADGTAIDYTRLGRAVANAISQGGISVSLDGRTLGTLMGAQANRLSRAG